MTEILPNLWVGNLKSRNNLKFLTSRKIQCVVNCCGADIIDRYSIVQLPIHVKQLHLGIIERGPEDPVSMDSMYQQLQPTINVIEHYLEKQQPVLVHCYAGRQRSPAIIMAYLIWKCSFTIKEAHGIVHHLWPHSGSDYSAALERYSAN